MSAAQRTHPRSRPRTRPSRRLPLLALLLTSAGLLAAPGALAQAPVRLDHGAGADEPPATGPWEILAVDREGRPVPGVELELIDSMSTVVSRHLGGISHTTDADGKITGSGDGKITGSGGGPYVLDIVSRDPRWSVAFVHGPRIVDESLGDDLLGRPLLRIVIRGTIVCVLEPTGTIRLRVANAKAGDRYHLCFVDDRPEPASHRMARASGSFDGAEGTLAVPAGRGTLYVARDGSLGSPILANGRPLLVAVTPGQTTEVAVRFFDGPTTMLMAPFGTIPFKRLEALTPDGKTVVADLPFETTPLRIPFALPVADGTPYDTENPSGFRLPRHLIRAADIPAPSSLQRVETEGQNPLRPTVEVAPMELIFTVDLGARLRFPEVAAGWRSLVEGGLIALGGSTISGPLLDSIRFVPGTVDLGALYGSTWRWRQELRAKAAVIYMLRAVHGVPWTLGPEFTTWSATVHVLDADSKPAAHREIIVVTQANPPVRAVTDAQGTVRIVGIRGDALTVAALHSLDDRAQAVRGMEGAGAAEVEVNLRVGTKHRRVTGTWRAAGQGGATVGSVLVLVPADAEEAAAHRAFGTRAYPIAIVDAHGAFDFGDVACREYVLRLDGGGEHRVTVASGAAGALVLSVQGTGTAATVRDAD